MNEVSKRFRMSGGRAAIVVAGLALMASHQVSLGQEAKDPSSATKPALSKEESDGIIFERQQLMLQLDKDAKTLGMIAAGSAPADKLAVTTRSIAQAAKESAEAFRDIVPGGRSKPEVWSNHAQFNADMDAFVRNTELMAKAGESGNLNEVTNLMIDALPCKQCHDRYRAPKTS